MGDLHRVIATGDRLRSLRVIRNHLALQLERAQPQNSAQIAAQLRATIAELAEIELTHKPAPPQPEEQPVVKEASALGDLAARIAARRCAAADPGRPANDC